MLLADKKEIVERSRNKIYTIRLSYDKLNQSIDGDMEDDFSEFWKTKILPSSQHGSLYKIGCP